MSEKKLIEGKRLKRHITQLQTRSGDFRVIMADVLDLIPGIDPVHTAGGCYCRECRYWENEAASVDESSELHLCKLKHTLEAGTDFCSHGKDQDNAH